MSKDLSAQYFAEVLCGVGVENLFAFSSYTPKHHNQEYNKFVFEN